MNGVYAWALCAALAMGACSKSEPDPTPAVDPVPEPASEAAETEPAPERKRSIYDASGNLRPSDTYAFGVRMPEGAELSYEQPNMKVYQLRAPIDKVLTFVGPLLITGRVEPQGRGATYRKASVRGAEISPTKVDVSIRDVGRGMTRIAVTAIPPPPERVPSQDDVLKAARKQFRQLD
ncbi:MAG: hypothetical protein AAF500_22085 [Myxococcota bacterium]